MKNPDKTPDSFKIENVRGRIDVYKNTWNPFRKERERSSKMNFSVKIFFLNVKILHSYITRYLYTLYSSRQYYNSLL